MSTRILDVEEAALASAALPAPEGNIRPGQFIDPTKVVQIALEDAASIAGLLITTETMVAN